MYFYTLVVISLFTHYSGLLLISININKINNRKCMHYILKNLNIGLDLFHGASLFF